MIDVGCLDARIVASAQPARKARKTGTCYAPDLSRLCCVFPWPCRRTVQTQTVDLIVLHSARPSTLTLACSRSASAELPCNFLEQTQSVLGSLVLTVAWLQRQPQSQQKTNQGLTTGTLGPCLTRYASIQQANTRKEQTSVSARCPYLLLPASPFSQLIQSRYCCL